MYCSSFRSIADEQPASDRNVALDLKHMKRRLLRFGLYRPDIRLHEYFAVTKRWIRHAKCGSDWR